MKRLQQPGGAKRGASALALVLVAVNWFASCSLLAPSDGELTAGERRDASLDGSNEPSDGAADARLGDAPSDRDREDACDELRCSSDSQCRIVSGLPACVCRAGSKGEAGACKPFASCDELHRAQPEAVTGEYVLEPSAGTEIRAYCEMAAEGGGWTLILNQNTTFVATAEPTTTDVCYDRSCTSAAYKTVRLRSDVMLDVRDAAISGANHSARVVFTAIDNKARGKTLYQMFTSGPYYLDNDLNTNVTVRPPSGKTCSQALTWEMGNLLCSPCRSDGGCGQDVMVFGDAQSNCDDGGALTFAIGAAHSSTEAWNQCAGWPEFPNYSDYDYLPDNYRVWLR